MKIIVKMDFNLKARMIVFLSLINYSLCFSQHNHNVDTKIPAAHKGVIINSQGLDFEVVTQNFSINEKLQIYIYKASVKPKNNHDTIGNAIIKYDNGATDTLTLQKSGEKMLYCNPTNMQNKFTAVIQLTYKKRNYRIVYTHDAEKLRVE